MSRYSLEHSPGGTSSGLRLDLLVYLRTVIVPDEPIRAKGTEWGNFSLTLHLRHCPTSSSSPSVSCTFGGIFPPHLHFPRDNLVPQPPLTAVQLRSSITWQCW